MSRLLLIAVTTLISINAYGMETVPYNYNQVLQGFQQDTLTLSDLDRFWTELSRTVREGDLEGYRAANHPEAVVVFAQGDKKGAVSISTALEGWKQGFEATKAGKNKNSVAFRFSQRINNDNNAHETGIFHYTERDDKGVVLSDSYIHFEALLVKRQGAWQILMEYQKSFADKDEWEALK